MSSAEDALEQQVSHSSVLFLLQEATKLAAPAEDESPRSAEVSRDSSRQVSDAEFTGSFAVMRESERSSAWEVMRLINQQCEWLLRSGHDDIVQADLDPPDTTETPSRPAEASPLVSSTCVSVAVVYSSELTETKEPDDEESGRPDVLSTESGCDLTSFLVSEREAENEWLHLNSSEAHGESDLNNNFLKDQNQEILDGRGRAQRKQPHPARSPDPQDAELQGVTFSMYPELDAGAGQSRLVINSNYRCLRRRRSHSRSLHTSQRSSSSEEESDSGSLARSKICASCCTRKTPLWRDAEDGTPLCNACGIRYKKYGVRCQQCWNIPKKEANTNCQCLRCGDLLKLKNTGW